MKRFLGLGLVAGALLLSACSDTVTNGYQDAKATATVNFMVRDAYTGSAIDSAAVIRVSKDTTTKLTDMRGFAQFTGVKIGLYIFRFEKAGYATMTLTQAIADMQGQVPRVPDFNLDIPLSKKGASVTGRVFRTDADGNRLAADSATVQLQLAAPAGAGLEWPTPIITTVTASDGSYTFDSLPAGVTYSISARQKTWNSQVYAGGTPVSVSDVMAGESKKAGPVDMAVVGNALRVNSTNYWGDLKISETSAVVLRFSEAVDTTRIHFGDIVVTRAAAEVLVTATWSDGSKTLSLKPADGKWWANSNHTISLNLVSVDNINLTNFTGNIFSTNNDTQFPGQASALAVDTGAVTTVNSSFILSWRKGTNATGYLIFKKNADDSAFVLVHDMNTNDSSYNVTGSPLANGRVAYRVLAYNSLGTAPVADAPAITVWDHSVPTLQFGTLPVTFTIMSNGALNNTSGSTASPLNGSTVSFSEAMDTTLVPTIGAPSSGASQIRFTWSWLSRTSAQVIPVVLPGKDANGLVGVTASIDFTTLKDRAGNSMIAPAGSATAINFDDGTP